MNGIELGQRVADVVGRQQLGKVLWSKRLRGRDRSLPQKASALYVCEQGCVLGDASDCVADRFRWADVTEFTKKISELRVQKTLDVTPRHKSTDYRFTFKLPDRTVTLKGTTSKLWVSAFDGFSELVSPLVCAAQLPGMLAALRNNETLEFGALKVALTGLSQPAWRKKNEHQLAWRDMQDYRVHNGELIINSRGRFRYWYIASSGQRPNFDALLAILKTIAAAAP